MKRLLKNGTIVNVFTDALERGNVLLEDGRIIGVGDYTDADADAVEDVSGKYLCPGFIDGHIHIESSMLQPAEFARACLPHGTTAIVADPHEIANVSGLMGIIYMLEASANIPMTVYIMVPSCVPATPFDEAGATLAAEDIKTLFGHPRVLGLGEMMNYPGVLYDDAETVKKLEETKKAGLIINGHAPLLSGRDLDKYIAAGIFDDHECSTVDEAMERLRKGQWVMVRQGTAARNLKALLPLFDEPYCRRCLLVTDDKHPADLLRHGHIDSIIREAVKAGKSAVTGIRMATLQAAQRFGLEGVGAVAPGYIADLLVLDDLDSVTVRDVYRRGEKVVSDGKTVDFETPYIRADVWKSVRNSFYLAPLRQSDFHIEPKGNRCRVIGLVPDQLITEEMVTELDFDKNNGVDTQRDILKLAVIERHMDSGHIGKGYISGMGLKSGAIASSVAHDSHNLIVVGTNDADMTVAANRIRELGGGLVVVNGGEVLAEMPLPIGGLMGKQSAEVMAQQNEAVRSKVRELGVSQDKEPFMSMAFVSLPVIPSLKMTTLGLVDVNKFQLVPLFVD
ncbi:MAG: adenine deaminase [Clostridiales bacterium]|nr:adenine deaminase [Candidatus Cacconaster stercorequi]